MNNNPRVFIATGNAGKLAEFERILGNEFEIRGIVDLDLILPPEGTESYRSNAEEKARFVGRQTGALVLGDDSGIEVRALGGQPGILSARFAGLPVSDRRNTDKLLHDLAASGSPDRSARFVCWLALANGQGLIASIEGTCEGTIGFESRGVHGFGYDPVFVFPDGRTMAELNDAEKDAVSHRGNAIRAMLPILRRYAVADNINARNP